MIELLEWVYQRGGIGAVIAAVIVVAYWRKDRDLRSEYIARRREAKRTAILLHTLLRRKTNAALESLPDFGDDDDEPNTGVISVRDNLEYVACRELDSDIEKLVRAYNEDIEALGAITPAETPDAKR